MACRFCSGTQPSHTGVYSSASGLKATSFNGLFAPVFSAKVFSVPGVQTYACAGVVMSHTMASGGRVALMAPAVVSASVRCMSICGEFPRLLAAV